MLKLSLHIGINQYPGTENDLSGCVNDANDFAEFFRKLGYDAHTLLDEQATGQNIRDHVKDMISHAKRGDKIVITNSSHGSYIKDENGDEPDGADEVTVASDFDLVTDDQWYEIFKARVQGVQVFMISDSCFSGSVNRFMPTPGKVTKVRFLPPQMLKELGSVKVLPPEQTVPRRSRELASAVLISGCSDQEYSYDAWFGDRANGAFTRTALDVYHQDMTMKQWHRAIRKVLPSQAYPQSPQFQCTKSQLSWRL